MDKKLYTLTGYMRCGDMPLYLLYYRDSYGRKSQCVMLCTLKNLRLLRKQKKGFSNPEQYGHVIFTGHAETSEDALKEMLKSLYDFDLDKNRAKDEGF